MIENMKCPKCKSVRLVKAGIVWSGHNKRQRYVCLDCHSTTIKPEVGEKDVSNENH
jgi:transposase-like protein